MSDPAGTASVAELSYEQARDELVRVVQQLEAGSTSLEQSITLWERGEALAARCEQWLVGARQRLERAKRDLESSDGQPQSQSAGAPPVGAQSADAEH